MGPDAVAFAIALDHDAAQDMPVGLPQGGLGLGFLDDGEAWARSLPDVVGLAGSQDPLVQGNPKLVGPADQVRGVGCGLFPGQGFAFAGSIEEVKGAYPGSLQESRTNTITGNVVPAKVTISGGRDCAYSVDEGTHWRTDGGFAAPGSRIRVRMPASSDFGGVVRATLNVEGTVAEYVVTSMKRPDPVPKISPIVLNEGASTIPVEGPVQVKITGGRPLPGTDAKAFLIASCHRDSLPSEQPFPSANDIRWKDVPFEPVVIGHTLDTSDHRSGWRPGVYVVRMWSKSSTGEVGAPVEASVDAVRTKPYFTIEYPKLPIGDFPQYPYPDVVLQVNGPPVTLNLKYWGCTEADLDAPPIFEGTTFLGESHAAFIPRVDLSNSRVVLYPGSITTRQVLLSCLISMKVKGYAMKAAFIVYYDDPTW